MSNQAVRLPSRKWSIFFLSSTAMAAVLFSYLLAITVALFCLSLPYVLFAFFPLTRNAFLYGTILLSLFSIAIGLTILWSLVPVKKRFGVNGVRIHLAMEPRLAQEIQATAAALREPMPSEIYLLADANAFVTEVGGVLGIGNRRILGLGLPLLQMLSIAQFRAILAHEFGHYYAGDTQLSPWVYSTRIAMVRVFQNLGKKSEVMNFFRRFALAAAVYLALMTAMRLYWQLFMRLTQAISRRQEFRSDELACYIAGSEALIAGLEGMRKCQAGLNSYWSSFVVPAAMNGFQPPLANGFQRFMQSPQIVKGTSDYLALQSAISKTSPYDTHPPFDKRIEQAKTLNLPAPASSSTNVSVSEPMISLIDNLNSLENSLLKKLLPVVAATNLKPLDWNTDGPGIYISGWRNKVAGFLPFLSTHKVSDLPALLLKPGPLADLVPGRLSVMQRVARAYEILQSAFALSLIENGWNLIAEPGNLVIEREAFKVDPGIVIGFIKAGKLSVAEWTAYCAERGIGDWPLASTAAASVAS